MCDSGKDAEECIFRNTALRYLGYAGHLGWICRSIVPFHIPVVTSLAYIFSDTIFGRCQGNPLTTPENTILWHFLATFAIPGIFLHGVNSLTRQLQTARSKCPKYPCLLPAIASAVALPIISKPIDNIVNDFLCKYTAKPKYYNGQLCAEYDNEIPKKKDDRFSWFFNESRDLNRSEIERYENSKKLKTENKHPNQQAHLAKATLDAHKVREATGPAQQAREATGPAQQAREPPFQGNQQTGECDLLSKGIQVDRTTRPSKKCPPKRCEDY